MARGLSTASPAAPHLLLERDLRALASDAQAALAIAQRRHGGQHPTSRQLDFWASLLGSLVTILDGEKEGRVPYVLGGDGELRVGLAPFPRPQSGSRPLLGSQAPRALPPAPACRALPAKGGAR